MKSLHDSSNCFPLLTVCIPSAKILLDRFDHSSECCDLEFFLFRDQNFSFIQNIQLLNSSGGSSLLKVKQKILTGAQRSQRIKSYKKLFWRQLTILSKYRSL